MVSEKARRTIIEVMFALKENRTKVRLVLVNLNGLAEGVVREDSLIGLEMDAQNVMQVKQKMNQAL